MMVNEPPRWAVGGLSARRRRESDRPLEGWMVRFGKAFEHDVARLANSPTTTEATYYPAIRTLLSDVLAAQNLPFEVRIHTSEQRQGGGSDLPDVAFYDGGGDFVGVCGEVKLASAEIEAMAASTDRNDQ